MTIILQHPVILFDGECNLCNRAVDFIMRHDKRAVFKFASLQSGIGKRLIEDCPDISPAGDTVVLVVNGKCWERSDAAIKIAAALPAPYSWLTLFRLIPKFFRDGVYNLVARNRLRWFGKRDSCRLPTATEQQRFL